MNYLILQVLFIGLIVVALPLNAENEHVEKGAEVDKEANISPNSVDGSAEISADKRYRLAGKRYRLHGKRASDDTSDELSELEKRYRLGKKSFDENEDEVEMEKRYRLAGKRYRLMGKRYRLMDKRGGYEVDSDEVNSNESDDESVESVQKRYRLSGNNGGAKPFKVNKE
jgi:hypothetical protein